MGTPAKAPRDAAGHLPCILQDAVSTVSTAQILRSSGYTAAEPAALRALSDIAGRYVASLGSGASAIAETRGRTEPNLVDLILALEDHSLGGFPGASDPGRPVLRSGALSELAGFVRAVREVPFAKPLPRRVGGPRGKAWESFAAAGREPPLKHVPRWLPCFPEKPELEPKATNEEATAKWESRRRDEGKANPEEAVAVKPSGDGGECRGLLPEKRGKVSFRVGEGAKKRRLGFDQQCGGGFERFTEMREKSAALMRAASNHLSAMEMEETRRRCPVTPCSVEGLNMT
ncbi:hypothetical protein E2562_007036 [Oryza meyeriana var. granulata]|uniref:Bromodomain associated domain-containing protein n=1 Tax=Oryza meyeriana var. granulata TaxID=110450 RepID=A0A6G1E9S0_9ORYZ|nr:hypothetical protein E2562_007036 [Oryza meyeriana var. granulata]